VEHSLLIEDHTSFRQTLALEDKPGLEVVVQKGELEGELEDHPFTVCAGSGSWVIQACPLPDQKGENE
jgi:hypothetical protein